MPRLLSLGYPRKRDRRTGSPPKRNGNMPLVGERTRHSGGVAMSAHARPTVGNATQAPPSKHLRWAPTNRMPSAFMIRPATPPSGWRTAGTIITAMPRRTARHGPADNAGCACCAGARTTARPRRCAPLRASDMIRTCDIRPMVSVWCGNCSNAVIAGEVTSKLVPAMTSKLRIMRTAAIIALATAGCLAWPAGPVIAAEKDTAAEVQVKVIRATPAYFTKEIRVAGLLVAREEAVVSLDIPAY